MFTQRFYTKIENKLPSASAILTFLCAVHCVALPMLPVFGSALTASVLENPWVELTLLPLAYGFAGFALVKSYRRHLRKLPVQLFITGVIIGVAGLVWHMHLLMALSALPIIAAQYANYKLQHVCCVR